MKMSNKLYDILKWIALCALPALSAVCCAISAIWKLGYTEQIVGTFTAIDAFLGAILGISSAQYKKSATVSDDTKSGQD